MTGRVTQKQLAEALRAVLRRSNPQAMNGAEATLLARYDAVQRSGEVADVRVAVAVTPNGDWAAWGSNYYSDDPQDKAAQNLHHDHFRSQRKTFHWLNGQVPIPQELEIEGDSHDAD